MGSCKDRTRIQEAFPAIDPNKCVSEESEMNDVLLLNGDVISCLRRIKEKSVRVAVTSPPYYGLRNYGIPPSAWGGSEDCNHEWVERKYYVVGGGVASSSKEAFSVAGSDNAERIKKARWCSDCVCTKCGAWLGNLGLEPTPEMFIEHLVMIFREVWRVLADDGTLWLNLGDSYWGGKGKSGQAWSTEHLDRDTLQKKQHQISGHGETRPTDGKHPVIKPKDLIGIPWMVAFALRADGWYLRQDIVWHKPNPMPESVKDRCTKAHEYIFLMSKSKKYYYDQDAIKEPLAASSVQRLAQDIENQKGSDRVPGKTNGAMKAVRPHGIVRNRKLGYDSKENVLRGSKNINAEGLEESMLPEPEHNRNKRSVWTVTTKPYKGAHFATFPPDLIEPCILAGSAVGDTVLDPFNGSGTTAQVSVKHKRNYIGCEISSDYIELSKKRISEFMPMFTNVTVEKADDHGHGREVSDTQIREK